MNKTVEDYLKEVDYQRMAEEYIPSPFAVKYLNFIKMVNAGKDDIQTSPLMHYKMADSLITRKQKVVNLCFRGSGKTSIMGEMLVLYIAVFNELPILGKVNVMMYVADSMENGAKSFRTNVEGRYNSSEFLQQYIPKAKFTDSELTFTNIEGKTTHIKLFGASSGVRGFKRDGDRPVLAIVDDLISNEMANSKLQLEKIYDTLYKDIEHALNPKRNKIVMSGTPFNKYDPVYNAVESGAWEVNVYPIASQFPCNEEDFNGAWSERFEYKDVLQKYNDAVKLGRVKTFNQELMLRITSEEDRVILDEDLRWFNSQELLKNKQKYLFYITTDFATSTNKRADYSVIGVWAVDSDGNRYLVDGVIGRFLMNKTFDYIFDYVKEYEPMSVGLEISGQQGGFIALFRQEMMRRNIYFTIARPINSTKEGIGVRTNKMDRFRLTEPWFKRGKIFLPKDKERSMLITEIVDELSTVTIDGIKSVHDDALDMISQFDQMMIVYPSPEQSKLEVSQSQGRIWEDTDFNEDDSNNIDYYLA